MLKVNIETLNRQAGDGALYIVCRCDWLNREIAGGCSQTGPIRATRPFETRSILGLVAPLWCRL
jgi:hypothetical protein